MNLIAALAQLFFFFYPLKNMTTCVVLPTNVWSLIRSYCSDTCYAPTPTSILMKSVLRWEEDTCGWCPYNNCIDGYCSTIYMCVDKTFFKKAITTCRDKLCFICNPEPPDWNFCTKPKTKRTKTIRKRYIRAMHIDNHGYFTQCASTPSQDLERNLRAMPPDV